MVMGDFSSQYSEFTEWMNKNGCTDILNNKYGTCPITYQRSSIDPIDCYFDNPSIEIRRGGCLPFGRLIGDHRGLWIDIPNELIYEFKPPPLTHPNARRLKMKDPRCVKRYNDKLDELCQKEQIYQRMNSLYESAEDPMTEL